MPHVKCWLCGKIETVSHKRAKDLKKYDLDYVCWSCLRDEANRRGTPVSIKEHQPMRK